MELSYQAEMEQEAIGPRYEAETQQEAIGPASSKLRYHGCGVSRFEARGKVRIK